jgi:hypothetical protein
MKKILFLILLLVLIYYFSYSIDFFDKTYNINVNCGSNNCGSNYPDVIVPVYSPWRTYYPWTSIYPYYWSQYYY